MSRSASPELYDWIARQSAAGHDAEALLVAMRDAGWDTAVARAAVATVLRQRPPLSGPESPQEDEPTARGVRGPDLALTGSPRRLDAGDRWVDVILTMAHPRIVVLGGLLSAEECDGLVAAARPRMSRSLTVQTQTGGDELNPDRTSDGMFFGRAENELVARIEARIARLLQWPVENGEGIQVLNYRTGAEYKPHYDYFDPQEPGTGTIVKRGGQRIATVVMYLNEPARGGGTTFPDVGLEVAPVRGNAVFFAYPRPHPGTMTLHGGAPVIEGEKWVATKWLRERVFE